MKRQPFMILSFGLACLTLLAVGCWGDSSSTDPAQSPAAPVATPPPGENGTVETDTARGEPATTLPPGDDEPFQPGEKITEVDPTDKQSVRRALLSQYANDDDSQSMELVTSHGAAVVPTLAELLEEEQGNVRLQAAAALGEIGPDAAPAVPALIKLLEDPPASAPPKPTETDLGKFNAFDMMGAMMVPAITRAAVIEALAAIGPEARSAGPALVAIVAEGDPLIFDLAIDAIEKTGADTQSLEADLMTALRGIDPQNVDTQVISQAAAIKRLGLDAKPAVSLLVAHLKANDVGENDPAATPSEPEAKPFELDQRALQRRTYLVVALAQLGADAQPALPALAAARSQANDRMKAAQDLGPDVPAEAYVYIETYRELIEVIDQAVKHINSELEKNPEQPQ